MDENTPNQEQVATSLKKATLHLSEHNGHICLRSILGDKARWNHLKLGPDGEVDREIFQNWVLWKVKFLWTVMPLEAIEIHVFPSFHKKYQQQINFIATILNRTNDTVKGVIKGSNGPYKRLLYVNVSEDMRYGSLYRKIKAEIPDTLYLNVDLGFNRELRKWEGSQPPMPVQDLLTYVQNEQVGKVVTVNSYFQDKYLNEGVNIQAIFRHMGVEWITIDNDPSDLRISAHLRRAAFNDPDCPRFSNMAELNRYWDKRFNHPNVTYCAIPQNYETGFWQKLADDYRIVVLSNSRWGSVEKMRGPIESILGYMANPWTELNPWYLATRRIILDLDLSLPKKMAANSLLHQFYFTAAQKVKFDIIKALNTDRQVEVYGDIGWQNVCPEYYKGSLQNDQVEELFARGNDLFLLLNFSLTYLDASGPVYDMIRRRVAWINIPPLVKTKQLAGLSTIEYRNPQELNQLISDVRPQFKKAIPTLEQYQSLLSSSVRDILHPIKGKTSNQTAWASSLTEHRIEIEKALDKYVLEKELFCRESIKLFIPGNGTQFAT